MTSVGTIQRLGTRGLDGGRPRCLHTEWSQIFRGMTLLDNPADRHSARRQEGSFGIRIRAQSDNRDIMYLNRPDSL
jgi:hypothetical protein